MAAVTEEGRVFAAFSDATGTFSGWTQLEDLGAGTVRGVILDYLDADGYPDLVTGTANNNEIVLYRLPGLASGGFGGKTRIGSFPSSTAILMDMASGDFNGDGFADIAANTNGTATGFFLSNGLGGYTVRVENLETGTARGMDAGDLNGDGRLDLVRGRCCDGMVSLYLGDGNGGFTFLRTVGDAGTDPYGVTVADFNTDGNLDVLANEGSSGNPILWRGNGDGTFLPPQAPAGGDLNNYTNWDAFDYNGDGNADLVAVNYTSQAAHFMPGLGNGNFGPTVRISPVQAPGTMLGSAALPYRHPRAPIARVAPPEITVAAGVPAHFDGSASTAAPGSAIAAQSWLFGDGGAADGAEADHTYAAKGRYWPRHHVRSDNGLSDFARALAIVTGPPPVAAAGGPYVFTEAQAVNELWTGRLDGSASAGDGGEGATYRWNLMPDLSFSDEFEGPLDPSVWISNASTVSGGTLRVASTSVGSWGVAHVASQQNFARRQGLTFYTRVISHASENIMFGFKNTAASQDYTQLQHAYYIAGSSLYVYEAGNSRGFFRTLAWNRWYDLKLELLASGAAYWIRPSGQEAWELVYTSTHASGPQLKVGFSGYFQGQNEFDYVYMGRRADGRVVTETFGGPGVFPVTLTVTDFLGQSSTSAASVTTSGEQPPVARTGGPYLFGEAAALNGQWVATLDGRTSTDDHGIAQYNWEFGDATVGTGAQPTHTYAGRGPHTLRLTVKDHAGQTHSDQGVVSFSASAPPQARIQGPALVEEPAANAGAWTAAFQGGTSSDDFGIWRYEWSFGNGRTASGANVTTQYTAMGNYTVTLTVYDHAGQSHSTTHAVSVRGNDLPVARIAGPASVDESAARDGLWTAAFNAAPSSDDFGIWRYQWAFGDGGTSTLANPTHQFAGPGTFTVRLTVFDHAGQSHFTDHAILLAVNDPPVARMEAAPTTVEGAREVAFNGLPSSDDFGISDWAWDFGERMFSFDGTALSTLEWDPSAGAIQDNRIILTGTGTWGARFVQGRRAYQRESEIRARVRVPAGTHHAVIGFKELGETAVLADFIHGIYFSNGAWRVLENGSNLSAPGTYTPNAEYEIRVVTKASGADYYWRPIANPAWTLLRSSAATTAYPMEAAWTVMTGAFEIDDVGIRARAHGSRVAAVFGATGQATLTVTDHARQTHSAVQAITVVHGAPPTAVIQGPDTYGAGLEANFSGLASADDHAIARYEWDFGDGSAAAGDRVAHSYSAPGTYTVRLTVHDYAGQTGTAARAIDVTGQNRVRCVPWRFNNGIEVPHETWTGKLITLKGVASSAPLPLTWEWDFGDGSPVAAGTATTEAQAYAIQAQHAYAGSHGTPYVATLSIVDAAGARSSDSYPIIMKDRTLTVETNVAIDEALWYLHKAQTRLVTGGLPMGYWVSYGGYRMNVSASAVQAFEINGHQPQGDPSQDPYVETVRRGLDHLMTTVSYNNVGPQPHGNPDANSNGIGIGGIEADQPYQIGAVMDALIASGSPTLLTRTGGTNVRGRRYLDIVQDMADMYAWGQDESTQGRGGWRYSWHGGSDNSAAQWGAIGLIPAERIWGVTVPAFVKSENQVWLNASYQPGTTSACGFGYTGPGHSNEQTPSGMVQLAFQRAPRTSAQWSCTEARMDLNWPAFLSSNTTYGYYAFTKAMRLAVPPVVNLSVSGRDWFDAEPDGLRRTLVTRQRADGSWLSNHTLPSEPIINTAWTAIILTPTLFENPPVAIIHASPNPGAVGQPVRFDGSQSYHVDPFRKVATYAWDFDASDGVDWTTPDAEGPVASHAFGALRAYTVSLRVGDDQDPANFDVATARIDITIPPHPPTAVPGGPYVAAAGEPVALDGSGSFDIDVGQGDFITRYGWETDFLNPRDFDDALGARATAAGFPAAGTYNVGLRVTDNTSVAFPQSGSPDLSQEAYTTVQVHDRCLESLSARGKATMVALTWTHDGSARYTVRRSTAGPSHGFEDIGTTTSAYSTFVDYNVETGRTYFYRVYSADDCASHAVSIVPRFRSTNRRPVFTSAPVTAAREGEAYAYDANAADPEGQALTYFLDEAPAGMTLDAATGLLAWTPTQAQVGSHPVAIRAVDPGDMAVVQAFLILVDPRPNLAPAVAVAGPAQGLSGQSLFFDGGGSADPEGDLPLAFAWNFGDGGVATGPSASHAFGAAGTFVVTLFVTDSRGATGVGTHTVIVDEPNRSPVARPGGPYIIAAGEPLTLDGSASTDPDGDPLAFTWHFGDNTAPASGAVVTHAYAAEGSYLASLEVSDGRGGIGGATVPVLVTSANSDPVAVIAASATFANPGGEITFDATGSTDADGDAMAFSWAFGDGTGTTGDVVTHVYGAPGRFTVTLTADDQRGRRGTATVEIHVNAPPAFADPGPLSALEDAAFVLALSAPDADGHAVTFSLVSAPAGMTAQNGPGSLFWLPGNADVGPHTVRVRAVDGFGGADETEFVLTVANVNDAPAITSEPVTDALELTAYLYGATAQDVDAGDAVTFSLVEAPAGMAVDAASGLVSWTPAHAQVGSHPVTLLAVDEAGASDEQHFTVAVSEQPWTPEFTSTPPAAAVEDQAFQYQAAARDLNAADVLAFSLVSGPSGMAVDAASGLVTWTPRNEHVGMGSVRLRVSDGALAADQEFTLAVANTNDAPVITSVAPGVAVVGEDLAYDVEAADPDAGDALTFALAQGSGDAAIHPATGLLSWTPLEAEVGEHAFRVLVEDAAGAFAAQDFTVRVQRTPEPPAFTSAPPTAATQGQPYAYQAAAADPNDDPLVFALVSGPAGLAVSPEGLVAFTPGPAQTGNQAVRISVSDSRFTVEQAFIIAVANVNDDPAISSVPPAAGTDGVTYAYQVAASDADGDALTYALLVNPAGMSISPSGLVSWPDDGARPLQSEVEVRVADGHGGTAVQAWTIAIVPDNVAPAVSIRLSANPVAPGQFVTVTVEAEDNVAVQSRTLSVAGTPVALAGNQYQYQAGGAGEVLLQATATDPNGNTGIASATLRVSADADAVAPQVSLTFGPANPAVGDVVRFSVSASDGNAVDPERTWLLVDGRYLPIVGGQAEFRVPMRGNFSALATAYDLAGNYGEARVAFSASLSGSDATPPQAEITAPADDTTLTGAAEVTGSAGDANFAYYTLSYSDRNVIRFVEFARSHDPVAASRLGAFDASGMDNGDYLIRLTVFDRFGNSASDQVQVHVSGYAKPGIFTLSYTDIKLDLPGLDLTAVRTYDSRDKGVGEFGVGWRLDLRSVKLNENRPAGEGWTIRNAGGFFPHWLIEPAQEHTVSVALPGGRKQEFDAAGVFDNPMFDTRFGVVSFKARPGTYSTLECLDGCEFIREGSDLVDWDFNPFDPDRYLLTLPDGTFYVVDQNAGGVTQMGDANGNTINLFPSGISHSIGDAFSFVRDAQNRITSITDGHGRTIGYAYDGHGNLRSVTDPEGNTVRYKYGPNHYVTEIIDPRGVRALRTEYDSTGKMVRQINPKGDTLALIHDAAARRETLVDIDGQTTVYTYNEQGRILSRTLENGDAWAYTYDAAGNLTSETDPDGRVKRSVWDARGNETSSTDPLGGTTTRVFNALNKVTAMTDPLGRTYRYEYNATGNLTVERNPDGSVRNAFTYNGYGDMLTSRDALGNLTTIAYDESGRVTRRVEPDGAATTMTYDDKGNLLTQTDPLGRVMRYTYDRKDNRLTETDALGNVTRFVRNSLGRVTEMTDPLGRVVRLEYDVFGEPTRTVYPDGASKTRLVDGKGQLLEETDESGRVTRYGYNDQGILVSIAAPDGSVRRFEYDRSGNRTAEIDGAGGRTEYGYDAAGRNISVRDPLGRVTGIEYDAAGRKTAQVDARENRTGYVYDDQDRLIRTVHPDGTSESCAYDAAGRKLSETDPGGKTTAYAYDVAGRLASVTDALGNVTAYAYDASGRLVAQTDAAGRTTAMQYDGLGRLVAKTYPGGARERMGYDAAGNLAYRVAGNGDSTAFRYDIRNREIERVHPGGRVVATAYGVDGKPQRVTDLRGDTRYQYDVAGRLSRVDNPDGGFIASTYDAAGRRLTATTAFGVTRYRYDAAGGMASVQSSSGDEAAYAYDAAGNLTGVLHPGGVETRSEYDARNRLTRVTHRRGATVLSDFSYALGAAGERLSVLEADGSRVLYAYDGVYRLTGEARTGSGAYAAAYGYDAVGNRRFEARGTDTTRSEYNVDDQLIRKTGPAGIETYAYDAAGRLVRRTTPAGDYLFTWIDRDRLASVTGPGGLNQAYTYDAQGRRVAVSGAAGESRFLVDELLPYGQVIAETDGAGVLGAGYLYGKSREAQYRGGDLSVYLADGLGSTRQLADADGAVTDAYLYDAFGNALDRSGTTRNDFLFAGEQADAATGLYSLRARWMDPGSGRFLGRDPQPGFPELPASLHRYLYANANPVNMIDPTGEITFSLAGISVSISIQGNLRVSSSISATSFLARFYVQLSGLGFYTVNQLRNMASVAGTNVHHAIEQRLWHACPTLQRIWTSVHAMPGIRITIAQHQTITNAWRAAFPYSNQVGHIANPTVEQIMVAARNIYGVSHPALYNAILRDLILHL